MTTIKVSKGARTRARILQEAQDLFASQGYAGTSLRQIADAAGLREPGLYNHFGSKEDLYEAVLQASLRPLVNKISERLGTANGLHDYTELPALFIDMLSQEPHLAALLQQALQDPEPPSSREHFRNWMRAAFEQGVDNTTNLGLAGDSDRQTLVLNVITMVNLTTGYFLSRQTFAALGGGDVNDPDNLARQKQLLRKVIRAMLIS